MARQGKRKFAITPSECLGQLPELSLDTTDEDADDGLRRAELRRSILAIAELNHEAHCPQCQCVGHFEHKDGEGIKAWVSVHSDSCPVDAEKRCRLSVLMETSAAWVE